MSSGRKKYFNTKKHTADEESSSSEDDQNGELLTDDVEKDFLKVLSHLKKKDPKLYADDKKFFQNKENTLKNSVKAEENQEEITQWLKGKKVSIEVEEKEELDALHDFWSNPNLDENEQFLRDYLLDKTFLKQDDGFDPSKEIEKLEEEEREVEEQLVFEEKFNYRFENCDEEFLKNYPRTMEKTCRRNSDTSEEEALENNKLQKNNEYKMNESVEPSNESDGAKISKNKKTPSVKKVRTKTYVKKQLTQPKGIVRNKRKVNIFEVTSSTRPEQEKINQKDFKDQVPLKTSLLERMSINNYSLLSNIDALKSKAIDEETKPQLKVRENKVKHQLNHVEYLWRVNSQSENKGMKSEFRKNRKRNSFLNVKAKKREISDLEKKSAVSSQNQLLSEEVLKKRKPRYQAIKCSTRPVDESRLETNPSQHSKLIAKRFQKEPQKRRGKVKVKYVRVSKQEAE